MATQVVPITMLRKKNKKYVLNGPGLCICQWKRCENVAEIKLYLSTFYGLLNWHAPPLSAQYIFFYFFCQFPALKA